MSRISTGKRLRFEVTACEPCNQGKAAHPLTARQVRPDADLLFLETQQEIAELTRYLASKDELKLIRQRVAAVLQDTWKETAGDRLGAAYPGPAGAADAALGGGRRGGSRRRRGEDPERLPERRAGAPLDWLPPPGGRDSEQSPSTTTERHRVMHNLIPIPTQRLRVLTDAELAETYQGHAEGFASVLRVFRERAGLSRNGLAHLACVDPSYLCRVENGERKPAKADIVASLAQALELGPTETNQLYAAAGYTPPVIDQLGGWDDTLQAVTDVLADERLGQAERRQFRDLVKTMARGWRFGAVLTLVGDHDDSN